MLNEFNEIAVIGAGTMGIGIAEVAASHNQKVSLYDLDFEFAQQAKLTMAKRLQSRVDRGKINSDFRQQIIDNISIVSELESLSNAKLVIEAIVENLEIKKSLFNTLQNICHENTLFASNTSSISITAIASILNKPQNMIGLHFFNPAPVMQLVEVIAGMRSSKEKIKKGLSLCEFWKKTAVLAQPSPGFIVNRVARPFYGESLKMLQEKLATPETMDALMQAAGFRMGPFALMDLIGMDINLSVSETVFSSLYYDPKYRPSLIQSEMVAANLLGKKSGQGFYLYDGSENPQVQFQSPKQAPKNISFSKESVHLSDLHCALIKNEFFNIDQHHSQSSLIINDCVVVFTNGETSQNRVRDFPQKHMAQVDLSLDYNRCPIIHLAFDKNCPESIRDQVIGVFQKLDRNVIVCDDVPALVVMRIVCLLINEAADAIENGVCSEKDVDLAMQKGVNYPKGLIKWGKEIGLAHVVQTLDHLHQWFGDDKYRVSPWLRKNC